MPNNMLEPLGNKAPSAGRLGLVTPREAEILNWLTQGKTYAEIAMILNVAPKTVEVTIRHLLQQSECCRSTGLVAWWIERKSAKQPIVWLPFRGDEARSKSRERRLLRYRGLPASDVEMYGRMI